MSRSAIALVLLFTTLLIPVVALSRGPEALAQAAQQAQTETTAQAAQQAQNPGALDTLKRTIEAQGQISPQTMEALKGSQPSAQPGGKAAPQGSTPGQAGKKAIYGDIIIHR